MFPKDAIRLKRVRFTYRGFAAVCLWLRIDVGVRFSRDETATVRRHGHVGLPPDRPQCVASRYTDARRAVSYGSEHEFATCTCTRSGGFRQSAISVNGPRPRGAPDRIDFDGRAMLSAGGSPRKETFRARSRPGRRRPREEGAVLDRFFFFYRETSRDERIRNARRES